MRSYHLKFLGLALCFLLSIISKDVYAAQCSTHNPVISLRHLVNPTEYIRDISSQELNTAHYGDDLAIGNILGVSGGNLGSKFNAKFEIIPSVGNLFCLQLVEINASFIATPKVYIASNFPRGSCEYSNVLRHELKHVSILKNTQMEYVVNYKEYIAKISNDMAILPPMKLSQTKAAKDYMVEQINSKIADYINLIIEDLIIRQKEIDTRQEYRLQQAKCKKWEEKLNK